MPRRVGVCLMLAAAAVLVTPAPAQAHVSGGRFATDYEARITDLVPAVAGVRAAIRDGDQQLELSVSPPHVVIVLGIAGEPFLRFSSAGVEVNRASPTATASRVVSAADAEPRLHGPVWRRVSSGHTLAWHENRLRPLTVKGGRSAGSQAVARWGVPMLVDGVPGVLRGTEWYAPGPSLRRWVILAAAIVIGAVAAAARAGAETLARIAVAVLPVVVAAWLLGWIGILLTGGHGARATAFAAAYAVATAALVAAVMMATAGNGRLAAAALLGVVAATFTLPEVSAFFHGYVLSALPATAARAAAAVSLAGGVALPVVCAPAIRRLLAEDPAMEDLISGRGVRS